jgi:uncharacterized membrane protein YfhO
LITQRRSIVFKIDSFFDKWSFGILCITLISIGFLVFKDYLLFKKLYLFKDIGSDTINLFYPHLLHISDYLRDEGIPRWSFNQGMGQNIFPAGIKDPFTLMLLALGRESLAYGIAYVEFLKVILAGIIFFYYLRLLSLTKYASLIGGLLFAFSGYMILGTGWWARHSLVVLHGAFLLFAFEKLYTRNSYTWFPLAVAIAADPWLFFYAEFLLLYTLFRFSNENRWDSKQFFRFTFKLSALGLLGLAISSFFLVGDALLVLQSPRIGGQVSYTGSLSASPIFFLEKPLHYSTVIMRLFSNDLLGAGSAYQGWYTYLEAPAFYCGLVTLLLLPQIFPHLNKRKKIRYALFLSFWLLLIIFPHFRYAFYLYTGDYYKNGLSLFIPITLLLFSLQALSNLDSGFRLNVTLLLSTCAILIGALYYPFFLKPSPVDSNLRLITASLLVIYAIFFSLSKAKKYRPLFMLLIFIVVCFELTYFSSLTVNNRSAVTRVEQELKTCYNDFTVEAVKYLKSNDQSFYRINKDYTSGTAIHESLNDAKAQGYYGTSSFSSFNQKFYIKFLREMGIITQDNEIQTRWAPGLTTSPLLQSFAATKYQLIKYAPNDFIRRTYVPVATTGDVTILKNDYALPLGFTYDHYISLDNFKVLTKLQKQAALFNAFVVNDPAKKFLKDFSVYPIDNIPRNYTITQYTQDVIQRKKHYLNISEHSQNHIKGTIAVDRKEMLFFSIPYDTGWKAIVDGKQIKPELVNIGFMGIVIGPGVHTVHLEYRVPFFFSALLISICAVVIYLFIAVQNIYATKTPG